MNKMLRYLSDYKRESVLAPLFKMLEATFDLFVPLVMADIVNVGIAAHDFHYILVRCGILLLLAIVGLACSLTAQYFSAKAAVGYSTGLRHALFEHIQTLSFSEMDTMGTSTLITRMTSDVNQVQSGLNLFLRLFLRSPFVVLGAMIMAFTVNFRAALIFVVAIPLLSIGLVLDPAAAGTWDTPIRCSSKTEDVLAAYIRDDLTYYKNEEGCTAVWIWAEQVGDGQYELFIGRG